MNIKIDNHIVELEKGNEYIKIWWNYNNNFSCTNFLYNIKEKNYSLSNTKKETF